MPLVPWALPSRHCTMLWAQMCRWRLPLPRCAASSLPAHSVVPAGPWPHHLHRHRPHLCVVCFAAPGLPCLLSPSHFHADCAVQGPGRAGADASQRKRRLGSDSDEQSGQEEGRQAARQQQPLAKRAAVAGSAARPRAVPSPAAVEAPQDILAPRSIEAIRKVSALRCREKQPGRTSTKEHCWRASLHLLGSGASTRSHALAVAPCALQERQQKFAPLSGSKPAAAAAPAASTKVGGSTEGLDEHVRSSLHACTAGARLFYSPAPAREAVRPASGASLCSSRIAERVGFCLSACGAVGRAQAHTDCLPDRGSCGGGIHPITCGTGICAAQASAASAANRGSSPGKQGSSGSTASPAAAAAAAA